MRRAWIGVAVVAALGQVVASQEARVGTEQGREISVPLPAQSVSGVESYLLRLADSTARHVGIERLTDEPLPGRVERVVGPPKRVVLTGRPLSEAISMVLQGAPGPLTSEPVDGFAWRVTHAGPVMNVAGTLGRPTFLDTPIVTFSCEKVTVHTCLSQWHRLFDASFKTEPMAPPKLGTLPWLDTPELAAKRADSVATWAREVSIDLKQATARDILNALVIAHGRLSWVVRYRTVSGPYEGSSVTIRDFSGAGFLMPALKLKK